MRTLLRVKWQSFTVSMARLLPSFLLKAIIYLLKKKYVIGVVAVVFNDDGDLLVLHHTYRREIAWRLPGGLKEAHETPFVTLVRELKEEANVYAEPIAVIAVAEAGISLDVAVLCGVSFEEPFVANAEVDERKWVEPHAYCAILPSEQRAFVQSAIRMRELGVMDQKL